MSFSWGCGSFWLINAKCWKNIRTINPTVLAIKIGIQTKKTRDSLTHSVDHAKKRPINLILLLKNKMKATINAAISNITIPTTNLRIYFPSKPLGESTKNNTPIETETNTDKKITIADMAWGMACTRMNHTSPIPKAISKLNLIVSYVFKNVHLSLIPELSMSLSLRLSSTGPQNPPNLSQSADVW